MKLLIAISIMLLVLPAILVNHTIVYAQSTVQLDKSLEKEGVTSPLPSTSGSNTGATEKPNDEAVQLPNTTVQAIYSPEGESTGSKTTDYYPDHRLAENETKLLIIAGVLCIFVGTILVTGQNHVQFLPHQRKKDLLLVSRHFGHNI